MRLDEAFAVRMRWRKLLRPAPERAGTVADPNFAAVGMLGAGAQHRLAGPADGTPALAARVTSTFAVELRL